MNNYLRNKIDVIEIDFPADDIPAITEDFADNLYDTSLWTLYTSSGIGFDVANERLEGTFGCCVSGDVVNYKDYQFYLTKLSEANTDIDVRGKAWKSSSVGNRASAIGFWSAANSYVMISPDNVFGTSGQVALLIRNGDSGGGGSSTFTYLVSVALNPTVERSYRITYDRSSNEIKFYYDNAGTWTQIGTTQVVDFGTTKFRVGAFQGIFNTSGGGTTYNDDLEVYYTPEGEIPPEVRTYKFISTDIPIQIANRYYGYKPLIKSVNDIPAEIREKDTVTRRLKVTCIDTLEPVSSSSITMASFWRMFIALRKNYKGREIRYYRRLGEGELELRFVGKVDNITLDSKGNTTIEAIDLMKALSKVDYPFLLNTTLAEDMPAIFNVDISDYPGQLVALDEAVPGDYARTVGGNLSLTLIPQASGSLPAGTYYFQVISFKNGGVKAINKTQIRSVEIVDNFDIRLTWSVSPNADYYRIYGITEALETLIVTRDANLLNQYDYDGTDEGASDVPDVHNWFQLAVGGEYFELDDWDEVFDDTNDPLFEVDIEGDITLLNDSGYLMIDEEIIYYDHILTDSDGYTLTGIQRAQFGTEAVRHQEDTLIYFIIAQSEPIDIFEMARLILLYGGIDEAYIHEIFDTYIALNILNVTCQPILQKTKLSNIYFDLINLADAMSFQNEEGMIEVLLHSDDPVEEILLTDEAHLIQGSVSLDLNEESRLTRWVLFWNRFNLDEELDSNDAYGRGNLTVDDDQEEYYEGIEQDIQHSAFLNGELTAEITAANDYANDLLFSRRGRTREAQWLLTASLEIKDDDIKLGQVVFIKTRNVLATDGTIPILTYRVIKKEPSANKIKFLFKRMIQDSSTES